MCQSRTAMTRHHWTLPLKATWCQFHQHFTPSFYASRSQKREKIHLSHQYLITLSGSASLKAVHRTLMKLSHGVNFINVLRATFAQVDLRWSYLCMKQSIYRAFHRFGQAKFVIGGLIIGSSQLSLLPKLPLKAILDLKLAWK